MVKYQRRLQHEIGFFPVIQDQLVTSSPVLRKSSEAWREGPIEDPNELGPAIERAIKYIKETGMPALVDAVTTYRG